MPLKSTICQPWDSHTLLSINQIVLSPKSHAPDLDLGLKLFQPCVEVLPPVKQHRVADELEPGRELESGIVEQRLELVGRDVFSILNLVLVDCETDVGLDEEDIINWGEGRLAGCMLMLNK